jgi:hypothetical protein
MSTDPVRRANLATIACDLRPPLPEGFRRNSTRVGAKLGAARTGLSVYELPPAPPEHTSYGTTASHPPASRCSPRSQPSVPSSTQTAT